MGGVLLGRAGTGALNDKNKALERMTLDGLVKTLQILVERRRGKHRPPLEASQMELEATMAEARSKKPHKRKGPAG
jgi:hypothetical protein